MSDLHDSSSSTTDAVAAFSWQTLSVVDLQEIDDHCERLEQSLFAALKQHREWQSYVAVEGQAAIEAALPLVSPGIRGLLFQELLAIEVETQFTCGIAVDMASYCQRFPDRISQIETICRDVQMELAAASSEVTLAANHSRRLAANSAVGSAASQSFPPQLGRYRILRIIGRGGFGLVYEGHDGTLNRPVAIKVPDPQWVADPDQVNIYLGEAKTVASLEHPHIIPVYEFGQCADADCFIVSRYIDGITLAERLCGPRMSILEVVHLVASIADALAYSHQHNVVHRDVKPGNILIGRDGEAYLADFGMALHEASTVAGAKCLGTPAYMSPEQARGEGHRVDGRSDIFSLGVVLYEALSGQRPFQGKTSREVLTRVVETEPTPLQHLVPAIPPELDRICQRALSKRTAERYSTANEMAADLLLFQTESTPELTLVDAKDRPTESPADVDAPRLEPSCQAKDTPASGQGSTPDSARSHPVPRGLRSFGPADAAFFPDLLPGLRDRHGLPESIAFWKSRIEQFDPDKTFSVGLLYGTSGCGKSSFIKAGLIPRLSERVTVVYVESNGLGTYARLLHELHRLVPTLPTHLTLKEVLSVLRRPSRREPNPQKLLIIIDQFEQWLHARRSDINSPLLQALRQCDGVHVQCILLVRDDFWLGVSRFMNELEIDLVTGENVALNDLFNIAHAKKVLAAFGSAYGALPKYPGELSRPQHEFLSQAVHGIAEEGRVVCVRLAIFAEMMKSKPWTPATLKEVGAAGGVGLAFLEETFDLRSSSPEYRNHRNAARSVLNALLPTAGTDIKGQMRSHSELQVASGYAADSSSFEQLIRILDNDLRLITPTDADDATLVSASKSLPSARCYQLTHDYLVPVLRDWLTHKQRETARGRAELRLEEHALDWQARSSNRYLPTWWEYANIQLLTRRGRWTACQKRMMRQASQVHGLRLVTGLLLLLTLGLILHNFIQSNRARDLDQRVTMAVATLATARANAIPRALQNMRAFPDDLVLQKIRGKYVTSNPREKLVLSYAAAHYGAVNVTYLVDQIINAPVEEALNLVMALERSRVESTLAIHSSNAQIPGNSSTQWRDKSRLAVACLLLGDSSLAEKLCQSRADPLPKTIFVDELSRRCGDGLRLAECATTIAEPALQAALCLAVGSNSNEQISERQLRAWQPLASDWYLHSTNSGVHSAASWMLNKWGLPLPYVPPSQGPADEFLWHVNTVGMTMLRIEHGQFQNWRGGFDELRKEPQRVSLTRDYLISDREVSVAEYLQAIEDENYPPAEKPSLIPWSDRDHSSSAGFTYWTGPDLTASPTPEHPMQQVSWVEAVMYCNWLSRKEGLAPSYRRTGDVWEIPTGKFEEWEFVQSRNGYRLPTHAEWEHACRAGTATEYSFGDESEFLPNYAVTASLRSQVCGSKFPNAWGLFDTIGNVSELANDWHGSFRIDPTSDVVDPLGPPVDGLLNKTVCGGHFSSEAAQAGSRIRSMTVYTTKSPYVGFRLARSLDSPQDGSLPR